VLRIIGGEFKRRRLKTPEDDSVTRPYAGLAREGVFNMLDAWFKEGAQVLDLFAGVGTMGLEAVSRGASRVLMVEQNRAIARMLQQNIDELDCGDRATAMQGDALGQACLMRAPRPVDIVFLDPPYNMMRQAAGRHRVLTQMQQCADVMADPSFLVLRCPFDPAEVDGGMRIEGLDGPEVHRYSRDMYVLLYQPRHDGRAAQQSVRASVTEPTTRSDQT